MMPSRFFSCALLLLLVAGCAKAPQGAHPVAATHGAATSLQASAADAAFISARAAGHGFASAADRGQLLAYPDNVVRHRGAYTWYRAALSEQHALRAITDGHLRVTTPAGQVLDFQYDRHVEHASGDWTWIGHIIGKPGEQAIVTFGAQAAFGSLAQPGKLPLRLAVRDGASWLVETDPAKVAGIVNAATRPQRPDYFIAPKSQGAGGFLQAAEQALPTAPSVGNANANAAATTTTVDLVLGYTSGFVTESGGTTSAALTRLNYLVDVANAAYQNSQINARVRLVKTLLVNYTDATSNDSTLGQLTGYDSATNRRTTPNAAFNALRAAREQYGADLVSLVRGFRDPEHDGCGIAWLIGGGQSGVSRSDEYFGYSVVSDGDDVGTDGKTYYCLDETLAHEMGHNMGSAHDRETSKGDDGVLDPDDYGAYPYSFGYKTTAATGNFYTIMAYGDTGQRIYRIFSDPRSTFCGGRACGVNSAEDNARSLTQTFPIIATFRSTVVAEPARTAPRDIDGDGNSDFMMHSSSFNRFGWWRMSGAVIQQGVSIGTGAGYVPVGSGDFNGDRKADLMWLRSASRLLLIQVSNGAGFVNVYQTTLGAGWNVVGAADINGDGLSDVLLHDPGTRQFQYWLMDGGVVTSVRTINGVGAGYEVAGYGDVNADGKADLLWTSAARDLYLWAGNGTTFTSARIDDYGNGFAVVGMADIDGDGRSDILFHNPGTRVFQYRLMQGFSNVGGRSIGGVGSGYSVAAYGDYNGDGKADLTWSSPASRAVYMWLGDGSTFASSYVGTYPSGWQPAPPANR